MEVRFQSCVVRPWTPHDRIAAANIISTVLAEYGLVWDPEGADRDVLEVQTYYLNTGGDFWVVEHNRNIVATAGYYPINRGVEAVEIRKMYLLPSVRGQGLGRFLLHQLETAIAARHYQQIWIETASVLTEAVKLYECNGYIPASGVETARCDRVYMKQL
ncbi:MAG: GNAT family N-acetyltransferase [Acaryochloridaceae cyanobacterium RU_4_10]|nr:GNAT family N-acetyltransferase [Acaryochloridaceae cyanobacterium RU_4_10]